LLADTPIVEMDLGPMDEPKEKLVTPVVDTFRNCRTGKHSAFVGANDNK